MYNGNPGIGILTIPDGVHKWSKYVDEFIFMMMYKLEKNKYKNTPTKEDLEAIMERLRGEIKEFEEQIAINKFDRNSFLELADIANFAFIAYVAIRLQEDKK